MYKYGLVPLRSVNISTCLLKFSASWLIIPICSNGPTLGGAGDGERSWAFRSSAFKWSTAVAGAGGGGAGAGMGG